jgi:hypothetical protein
MKCCPSESKPIFLQQGQTANIDVFLIDEGTGQPFSLQGLTGATGIFPAADGQSGVAASGYLQSADLGHLQFQLDIPFIENMLVGENMNFQVMVDQSAQRSIANIVGYLTVNAPPFQNVTFGP